ncbi:site-specific integrase [Methylophilus sp. TWE2]|uniref:site-specific integrase n=1 Tax=Methylophilus sp. TWE2 TaxID=1662285 RepID=UPI00067168A6|nr:site-specific integrase [Methylophilus sp. TWE2]AKR44391.1 hypothetical protein ACJ67_13990 [Methylophilus sp. TWE2]
MSSALAINKSIDGKRFCLSKMGYEIDIFSNSWKLDGSLTLNWHLLKGLSLESNFEEGFRRTLAVFASEMSASYTSNIFHALKTLLEATLSNSLSASCIQNYLGTLDKLNEYKLGILKAFILDWDERGYPGLNKDVVPFIDALVLKGNVKGKAVSKGCPHTGAYSLQEQQSILTWAVNSYDADKLDLEEFTWLIANMYLGSRPVQIRSLIKGDISFSRTIAGNEVYQLKRIAGKQRDAGFREVFDDIEIDEDLALLLFNQAEASIAYIEGHFGKPVPKELIDLTPIFISREAVRSFRSLEECYQSLETTPDFIFMRSDKARTLMLTISAKCNIRTPRLDGEYLSLRSRRFRYTLGTNASRRGLGAYHIAKILGHKDIQNVKAYVENTSEVLDIIDEAMTSVLAPLAQAFAGTLINSERDAIRANDPRSRIRSNDGSGVGSCGEFGFCASGGRQCYLCSKFQPWIHGHHEKILDSVLSEREALRQRGASEFVIQSTDRLLLAIEQVVQLCDAAKLEGKGSANE